MSASDPRPPMELVNWAALDALAVVVEEAGKPVPDVQRIRAVALRVVLDANAALAAALDAREPAPFTLVTELEGHLHEDDHESYLVGPKGLVPRIAQCCPVAARPPGRSPNGPPGRFRVVVEFRPADR